MWLATQKYGYMLRSHTSGIFIFAITGDRIIYAGSVSDVGKIR